jgi:putative transposase
MANLFIDVLRTGMRFRRFDVLNFVVMPNHVHLLLRLPQGMELEKAMQLIKGGFSFRAKRELGFNGEVWQRGFSDLLVANEESLHSHVRYIEENPVKAGLARSAEEYEFGFAYLNRRKGDKYGGPAALFAGGRPSLFGGCSRHD